ncbi:MAG: iron-containing alcohol dehydrogenase [Pseudomonadota bacterium]
MTTLNATAASVQLASSKTPSTFVAPPKALTMGARPGLVSAAGGLASLGQHVTQTTGANAKVLLVSDPALSPLGFAGKAVSSLESSGHQVVVFEDFTSDPKESAVNAALAVANTEGVDAVVGLGGGSALDLAKLVSGLALKSDDCAPYRLAAQPILRRKVAFIAVPTTSGTGAETTRTSIISQADGTKNWFWDEMLVPDLALLDPELTVGLPAYWTLYTGLDALVHAVESRTNRYRFAENDAVAERAIALVAQNLERTLEQPNDLEARGAMQLAAAYGGMAINNTGCAVAHNIGHAMGSLAGVPHGRAVSIALVATLSWSIEGNQEAFAAVARAMGLSSASHIAPWMDRIAERVGESLRLSEQEREWFDKSALATAMMSDANRSMLEALARDAAPEDVDMLAELAMAA